MGQSNSWYFERSYHLEFRPDTKLTFIEKSFGVYLQFLILSDEDHRNSNIARVGTPCEWGQGW
jgi:hypothetical protein